MSSWRRNRAFFDSLRPRHETKKRSLRGLRYRNGILQISGDSLSRVTQGKQRNAIVVTQTIALARIVLSIGEAYSRNKWISPSITRNASIAGILFFFVVATNRDINLFIKLSPLLLGMYCSDCLEQKQANQNPFLSRISRERGPTHPYLCDVKALFDLFINLGLNWWRHIVNMLWTQVCRFKTENKQFWNGKSKE